MKCHQEISLRPKSTALLLSIFDHLSFSRSHSHAWLYIPSSPPSPKPPTSWAQTVFGTRAKRRWHLIKESSKRPHTHAISSRNLIRISLSLVTNHIHGSTRSSTPQHLSTIFTAHRHHQPQPSDGTLQAHNSMSSRQVTLFFTISIDLL